MLINLNQVQTLRACALGCIIHQEAQSLPGRLEQQRGQGALVRRHPALLHRDSVHELESRVLKVKLVNSDSSTYDVRKDVTIIMPAPLLCIFTQPLDFLEGPLAHN